MKKVYEKPNMTVETFSNNDIITVSNAFVASNFNVKESLEGENTIDF